MLRNIVLASNTLLVLVALWFYADRGMAVISVALIMCAIANAYLIVNMLSKKELQTWSVYTTNIFLFAFGVWMFNDYYYQQSIGFIVCCVGVINAYYHYHNNKLTENRQNSTLPPPAKTSSASDFMDSMASRLLKLACNFTRKSDVENSGINNAAEFYMIFTECMQFRFACVLHNMKTRILTQSVYERLRNSMLTTYFSYGAGVIDDAESTNAAMLKQLALYQTLLESNPAEIASEKAAQSMTAFITDEPYRAQIARSIQTILQNEVYEIDKYVIQIIPVGKKKD